MDLLKCLVPLSLASNVNRMESIMDLLVEQGFISYDNGGGSEGVYKSSLSFKFDR